MNATRRGFPRAVPLLLTLSLALARAVPATPGAKLKMNWGKPGCEGTLDR